MRVVSNSAGVLTAVIAAALALAGCGGTSSSSDNGSGMSQAAAEGLATQLSTASAGAANSAQSSARLTAAGSGQSSLLVEPRGADSVQCTADYSSCTYDIDTSYTNNCTAGGSIHATGNLTGTMNSSGTGMLQIQITETITDWQCISGYVINGDPDISLTGTFSYVNGNPGTNQSMTISGGFKWGSGSCQIHLSTLLNASGGWTTTGTVCGYTVAISST
jgi:hypothetical protein